jgi:ribosome-associated protein
MIPVTDSIAIEEDELSEKFVRASGPGGQHVNTSSSAVELRFDARNSPSLPEEVKHRLVRIAGQRMNQDGVIVIFAQSYRSQEMNRQDARTRLIDLIEQATHRPKPRKKTRPTYASKLKRLDGKSKRAGVKVMRGRPTRDD